MASSLTKFILKSGKDQSLLRFHPWVFSGAIKKILGNVQEGDVVSVYSNKDEFLGIGHYQIGSITVRIFSFEEIVPDEEFWQKKIETAISFRKDLGFFDDNGTNAFRLINAEGDGMPGLIVDFYNGVAVTQMHSVGMYLMREKLAKILVDSSNGAIKSVFDKSSKTLPAKANLEATDGYLINGNVEKVVEEYGLKFNVDWKLGQKTGFFIDQRENRKLVEHYSAGRDVLNMFCYTGGFSFYAMRGKAKSVHSVDSSAKAIDLTNENIALNFPNDNRHEAYATDAFDYLKNIEGKYDLIILDPPAFAKHRDTLSRALKGYKRINARAFEQIRPGGLLFTFSCSQVVSKDKFREAVFSAAAISKRSVKIIHQLTQPADHPVSIYHPEGEYLKGLVLRVD